MNANDFNAKQSTVVSVQPTSSGSEIWVQYDDEREASYQVNDDSFRAREGHKLTAILYGRQRRARGGLRVYPTPSRLPRAKSAIGTGMVKNIFNSKITATASPEIVVIGFKMLDSEAHTLRFVGLALLAISIPVLIFEWRKKANVADPIPAARRSRKPSRSRISR
ncbi:MAG: hypothetical protein ABSH48_26150 [Verrucomicrobiota bacterium]|jgi:hypothetical protein